jgi:hypothetical protein
VLQRPVGGEERRIIRFFKGALKSWTLHAVAKREKAKKSFLDGRHQSRNERRRADFYNLHQLLNLEVLVNVSCPCSFGPFLFPRECFYMI